MEGIAELRKNVSSQCCDGRRGWKAFYVKIVDSNEETVRFFQEIYDNKGVLAEVHEKFPVDKGHKNVKEEES